MRDKDWWKEPLDKFHMRTLYHALSEYDGDDVWGDVLTYAMQRPWVAELEARFGGVRVAARTDPWTRGDDELLQTLFLLYASSRVRDVLVFPYQPPPLDPEQQRSFDE